jgi:hypothetical protein
MVSRRCALLLSLLLVACGEEDPCPYGSLLDSPAGLTLTAAEHPTGWGQAECVSCHVMETLHRSGCSPDIDPVELQDEVAARGLEGCVDCHGNNGVSE